MNKPEIRKIFGSDGSPVAAQEYGFDEGGREVVVEVQTSAIRTLDGQLAYEEVVLAAKTLVEATAGTRARLVLDETNMAVVANRLNWGHRFNRE